MTSAVKAGKLTHIIYTGSRDGVDRLYINGTMLASGRRRASFAQWDAGYRLALANELSRDRPWYGALHLVAIYERALSADEVALNAAAGIAARTR